MILGRGLDLVDAPARVRVERVDIRHCQARVLAMLGRAEEHEARARCREERACRDEARDAGRIAEALDATAFEYRVGRGTSSRQTKGFFHGFDRARGDADGGHVQDGDIDDVILYTCSTCFREQTFLDTSLVVPSFQQFQLLLGQEHGGIEAQQDGVLDPAFRDGREGFISDLRLDAVIHEPIPEARFDQALHRGHADVIGQAVHEEWLLLAFRGISDELAIIHEIICRVTNDIGDELHARLPGDVFHGAKLARGSVLIKRAVLVVREYLVTLVKHAADQARGMLAGLAAERHVVDRDRFLLHREMHMLITG